MKNIIVDYETYYDPEISVVTQGLYNYTRSADAYLLGMISDDFEYVGPLQSAMTDLPIDQLAADPHVQFWAANSNFDQSWWEKYGPTTVHPWRCILDLARFHQLPRDLANVVRVVFKHKLDKSVRSDMKGVRFESLPDAEQQRVADYCLEDCRWEKRVLDTLPPMSPIEDRIALHTRMINRRGVHVDLDKVQRDKTNLERLRFEAFKSIPWTRENAPPLSYPVFSAYCSARGVAPPASLDKRDEVCRIWMEQNPELAKVVRSMRLFRGVNTKLEKLKDLLLIQRDGIMPLEILYCGAPHTRRWSSKGFNVQNLDKEPVFGDEMAAFGAPGVFMREYLIPPPGCRWLCVDLAQIEPRCLNWLAGNDEMMIALRQGFSYYEAYARAAKNWKGAPSTLKAEFGKDRYTKLKNEALGLGYGMGPVKYVTYTAAVGQHVSPDEAKAIVRNFRLQNPKVVALWRHFDGLIQRAALDPHKSISIEMPTGDLLQHYSVRVKGALSGKRAYESFTIRGDFSQQSHQMNLWGGVLTENVTQRMARDVLAEQILALEDAGLPVYFHAHDEVIVAVPKGSEKEALAHASQIMRTPPAWCDDLPLDCEGQIADHYIK